MISGNRTKKRSLTLAGAVPPSDRSLSRFGTVSDQTDWLALAGFLVELFAMGHFRTHAERSHPLGSVPHGIGSSPCQTG